MIKKISLKTRIAGSKTNERKQQTSLHQSINPSIQLYYLYAITCTWVPLTQAVSAAEARGEPLPKKNDDSGGSKVGIFTYLHKVQGEKHFIYKKYIFMIPSFQDVFLLKKIVVSNILQLVGGFNPFGKY